MDPRTELPRDCPPEIGRFKVSVPVASMRRRPSHSSGQDTQLLFGEGFTAYRRDGDWMWGQCQCPMLSSSYPGYIGYVNRSDFTEDAEVPTHVITHIKAPVFSSDNIKSPIQQILHMGSYVSGTQEEEFLRTQGGYIHWHHLRSIDQPPSRSDFVSVAEQFLGLPYIWGGMSADGMDCSGLVLLGLRAKGRDAPRDSDQQAQMGRELESSEHWQRGDLVFWKGHVGIMQDPETVLHANAYHMSVVSEPLAEAEVRIKKTAGPVTARRRIS